LYKIKRPEPWWLNTAILSGAHGLPSNRHRVGVPPVLRAETKSPKRQPLRAAVSGGQVKQK
jgi:hypothetical protein